MFSYLNDAELYGIAFALNDEKEARVKFKRRREKNETNKLCGKKK